MSAGTSKEFLTTTHNRGTLIRVSGSAKSSLAVAVFPLKRNMLFHKVEDHYYICVQKVGKAFTITYCYSLHKHSNTEWELAMCCVLLLQNEYRGNTAVAVVANNCTELAGAS